MEKGQLSSNMKTIVSTNVENRPSLDLLPQENPRPKPKSIPNTTPLLSISDLPTNYDLVKKPKISTNTVISIDDKKAKEKALLEKIHKDLENVRLNLLDSNGQGFLMNASAIISSYIRNNYS